MDGIPEPQKPFLEIRVDARQFDEQSLDQAASELQPYFAVRYVRSVKLSDQAPLLIIFAFVLDTLRAMPANLLSSVLYDWVKKHATHSAHNEEVTVIFKVLDGGDTVKDARITMPGSEGNVKEALATISEFLERQQPANRTGKSNRQWKKSR